MPGAGEMSPAAAPPCSVSAPTEVPARGGFKMVSGAGSVGDLTEDVPVELGFERNRILDIA